MASKNTPAVLDEDITTEAEISTKSIVNDAINGAVEALGMDGQKSRYKAMRAIAFQAFTESIEAGDFDALVDRAIANVGGLPHGWEIEKAEAGEAPAKPARATKAKADTAAKAPAKTAAAKKPAAKTAAAKAPARKRPTR